MELCIEIYQKLKVSSEMEEKLIGIISTYDKIKLENSKIAEQEKSVNNHLWSSLSADKKELI
jgi:hypothetical protein